MRESIGSSIMYGIIAIFIVMVFAILAGTMSYFKAFKVNSQIVGILEKYEGYNSLAKKEINRTLSTLGYRRIDGLRCKQKNGAKMYPQDMNSFTYCVYVMCDSKDPYLYHLGVTTYIQIDFPIISTFLKLPVYSETNSIHIMGERKCSLDMFRS